MNNIKIKDKKYSNRYISINGHSIAFNNYEALVNREDADTLLRSSDFEMLYEIPEKKPLIPKIIYYTWVSDKPLPFKFRKYIDGWKTIMPDYEIRPITLENCPHNEWVDKAIKEKKFVLAGHYARVQRLYETGGVYLDIDVEVLKSFDDLLYDEVFLGAEDNDYLNNAVMGSIPGHEFFKDQMDYMVKFDIDSKEVENETGPRMVTNILKSYGWSPKNETTEVKGIKIYDSTYFYPYYYTKSFTPDCIKPTTYSIHHWANTWGKNNGLVSIVIPCYKQSQWLGEAIDSALKQTYQNIEVIVVSDGSPDNTVEVALQHRVKLIVQDNQGVSSARNSGIKQAKGKWILCLDADDKIDHHFLERTIDKDDIVTTKLTEFGDHNGVWQGINNPTLKDLKEGNQLNCCSLFKREIWEEIDGYDEEMHDGYEDWDLWIRARAVGYTITNIGEPLFFYRKHGISMINGSQAKDKEIREYMTEKYKRLRI